MITKVHFRTFENGKVLPHEDFVVSRDFEDVRLPAETLAFQFCDEDESDHSKKSNISPVYLIGERFSYEEAQEKFQYNQAITILLSVLEGIGEGDLDIVRWTYRDPYDENAKEIVHWDCIPDSTMVVVTTKPAYENKAFVIPVLRTEEK